MRIVRGALVLAASLVVVACDGDGGGGPADAGADAPLCTPGQGRAAESAGAGDQVALARSDSGYGLVWPDSRHGDTEIYFVRLSPSGGRLGSDVRLTDAAGPSTSPAVAWNGDDFAVVWSDDRDGSTPDLYFVRATVNGTIVGVEKRITTAAMPSLGVSLVWTGSEYGLAWHDFRDGDPEIYFARLDASGTKIGEDLRVTESVGQSFRPSLQWTGTSYALSWNDNESGDHEIYLARLSATGEPLGTTRVTSSAGESLFSSLAWTGSGFGVIWNDSRTPAGVYFARLAPDGAVVGTEKLVADGAGIGGQRSLTWTGSEHVMSFEDDADGDYDVFVARLDESGTALGEPVRVTSAAGDSLGSATAPAREGIGLGWVDAQDGPAAPHAAVLCW